VVGGGIAGLACARALVAGGAEVTVFDKGRGVGGRATTHRVPPHTFDLGAQYFTARDAAFIEQVERWEREGVCRAWEGRIVAWEGGAPRASSPQRRYVGTSGMGAIARALAEGLTVRRSHRIDRVRAVEGRLVLDGTVAPGITLPPARARVAAGGTPEIDEATAPLGRFDGVVLAMPPEQAAVLLAEATPHLAARARAVAMTPCVALGIAYEDGPGLRDLPFDGVFFPPDASIAWLARDSSKPGRPAGDRWVAHASPRWSRELQGEGDVYVIAAMRSALGELLRRPVFPPHVAVVRRWLAASPAGEASGLLRDLHLPVVVGGDWAVGGRVEGAYLAGLGLAGALVERLGSRLAGGESGGSFSAFDAK
jgi:hypothetical protein